MNKIVTMIMFMIGLSSALMADQNNTVKIDNMTSEQKQKSTQTVVFTEKKHMPYVGEDLGLNEKMCSKGKKIFRKKLRKKCGFTGAKFAAKHTIKEWIKIEEMQEFKKEINIICSKGEKIKLKDDWEKALLQFSKCYASDSGNFAPC